jgi:SAM-dependent methyltransferase
MPHSSSRLRRLVRQRPGLRHTYQHLEGMAALSRALPAGGVDFERLPPAQAVELAYQVVLRRRPDPATRDEYAARLRGGSMGRFEFVDLLVSSSEFKSVTPRSGNMLVHSLHASRCEFVRSLPPARTIVDLGGTDLGSPGGALVSMGYPYRFDSLTVVDLPNEDRHETYRHDAVTGPVDTPGGRVYYRYHSMTDLGFFADASVDLVYSGQSIEHVTQDDATRVLSEVARILVPGGHLGLDTPNATVTRLERDDFIDPDHKYEYAMPEVVDLVRGSGLEVVDLKGANWAGESLAAGRFDAGRTASRGGLYWDAGACYLTCLVARKPGPDPSP